VCVRACTYVYVYVCISVYVCMCVFVCRGTCLILLIRHLFATYPNPNIYLKPPVIIYNAGKQASNAVQATF